MVVEAKREFGVLSSQLLTRQQPEFEPDGLRAWIRDNSKQFNAESYTLIQDIELIIKSDFADKLQKSMEKMAYTWDSAESL